VIPISRALKAPRLPEDRDVRVALAIACGMIVFLLLGPMVAALFGLDPYAIDPAARYAPISLRHPLGTDDLGRDVLARLLFGARISLLVAGVGTLISMSIGTAVGLVSGYLGGAVDRVFLRLTEVMTALPKLPLMILIAGIDAKKLFGGMFEGSAASVVKLTAIVVLFGWMTSARLARTSALQIREMDYVTAARALGATDLMILLDHILPNAAPVLLVAGAQELAEIVLYESVLSFLGLGIQPPIPSLGAILASGMTYLHSAPLLLFMPGLLTFAIALLFQVAAERIRDALDPRRVAHRSPR
jgi:peptide/nickel transport system permease protein